MGKFKKSYTLKLSDFDKVSILMATLLKIYIHKFIKNLSNSLKNSYKILK